jgi:hypothetical protein
VIKSSLIGALTGIDEKQVPTEEKDLKRILALLCK